MEPINILTNTSNDLSNSISNNCLKNLEYFPQPLFLLSPSLELLETNQQGHAAIEGDLVSLKSGVIRFHCETNNKHINIVTKQLKLNCYSTEPQKIILRGPDMLYRVFTIFNELPLPDSNFILIIQNHTNPSIKQIPSLARAFSLSTSETRIVEKMVEGLKPKEIAYELSLSLNTIRSHLRTLYAKMQVKDFTEALTESIRLIS